MKNRPFSTFSPEAVALAEALLQEVTVLAKHSIETKGFSKQLYKLKHRNYKQFWAVRKKFRRWRLKPDSVNFEAKRKGLYAVELPDGIHAVCEYVGDTVLWLMIGSYNDYEAFLNAYP